MLCSVDFQWNKASIDSKKKRRKKKVEYGDTFTSRVIRKSTDLIISLKGKFHEEWSQIRDKKNVSGKTARKAMLVYRFIYLEKCDIAVSLMWWTKHQDELIVASH